MSAHTESALTDAIAQAVQAGELDRALELGRELQALHAKAPGEDAAERRAIVRSVRANLADARSSIADAAADLALLSDKAVRRG